MNSLGEPTHHLNHMRSSSMASCCSDSPTLIFGEGPPLALEGSPTRAEARDDVGHVEAPGGRLGDPTLGSQVVPATPQPRLAPESVNHAKRAAEAPRPKTPLEVAQKMETLIDGARTSAKTMVAKAEGVGGDTENALESQHFCNRGSDPHRGSELQ